MHVEYTKSDMCKINIQKSQFSKSISYTYMLLYGKISEYSNGVQRVEQNNFNISHNPFRFQPNYTFSQLKFDIYENFFLGDIITRYLIVGNTED